MSYPCAASECTNVGTKKCATCRVVSYCCKECQKKDWKTHKKQCAALAMSPGGATYREVYKDKEGVHVFEDMESGRSFTLGAAGDNSVPAVQFAMQMIRDMQGFTGPYTIQRIVNGKPVTPPPPHRMAVGDEVLVAIGQESFQPPYTDGWKRGVVRSLGDENKGDAFAYKITLTDGSVVPAHRDDPDFVRRVDENEEGKAIRFDVGTEVECRIGPSMWTRGVVRQRNAEYPGWGRGWTDDGEEHPGWQGPKDTMAYIVTPEGKRFDENHDDPYSTLSVPADKDDYIRAWEPRVQGLG